MHEIDGSHGTKHGFLFLTINHSSVIGPEMMIDYDIITTVMIITSTTVIITVILQHNFLSLPSLLSILQHARKMFNVTLATVTMFINHLC